MKILLLFIVTCFFVGGTQAGRFVLRRPSPLLLFAVLIAASYWSLAVVLG